MKIRGKTRMIRAAIAAFVYRNLFRCAFAAVIVSTFFLCGKVYALDDANASEHEQADANEKMREFQEEIESSIDSLLGEMDFSEWNRAVSSDQISSSGESAYETAESMIGSFLNGESDFDAAGIFGSIIDILIPEVKTYLRSMIPLAAVMLISGVAAVLFKGDFMEKPLELVLKAVSILAIASVFASISGGASKVCASISAFSEAITPVLGLLLTASGLTEANAMLLPKLSILSAGIAALITGAAIPILLASGVITLVSAFTDRFRLFNMMKLAHSTVKWLVGIAAVVYSGTLIISGVCSYTGGGVTFRGAKYAFDKLLPMGGGIITATIDASTYGAHIVKNAAGAASIVLLFKLILRPLLAMVGGMLAFRLTAAIIEPFSEPRIPAVLSSLADTLSYMLACCACAAAMLVFTICVIIAAGKALY